MNPFLPKNGCQVNIKKRSVEIEHKRSVLVKGNHNLNGYVSGHTFCDLLLFLTKTSSYDADI